MKSLLIFVGVFVLSGCAPSFSSLLGVPGVGKITESKSEFDGSTAIKMEQAYLYKSDGEMTYNRMSLFRRSTQPAGEAVLTVYVYGSSMISDPDSLKFNIDGKIVSFTSMDGVGEVISGQYGVVVSKRYLVTAAFIKRLLIAERVAVKINLGNTFVEGMFSQEGMYAVKPAFQGFYDHVFGAPAPPQAVKF